MSDYLMHLALFENVYTHEFRCREQINTDLDTFIVSFRWSCKEEIILLLSSIWIFIKQTTEHTWIHATHSNWFELDIKGTIPFPLFG